MTVTCNFDMRMTDECTTGYCMLPMLPVLTRSVLGFRAKTITEYLSFHVHWVDLYFQDSSLLLARKPVRGIEILNDRNHDIEVFRNVMGSPEEFEQFCQLLQQPAKRSKRRVASTDDGAIRVERAVGFFRRWQDCYRGLGLDLVENGTVKPFDLQLQLLKDEFDKAPGVLRTLDRLSRCRVVHRDPVSQLQASDSQWTVFMIAPELLRVGPSVVAPEQQPVAAEEWERLLAELPKIKGTFVILGQENSELDAWAKEHAFERWDFSPAPKDCVPRGAVNKPWFAIVNYTSPFRD